MTNIAVLGSRSGGPRRPLLSSTSLALAALLALAGCGAAPAPAESPATAGYGALPAVASQAPAQAPRDEVMLESDSASSDAKSPAGFASSPVPAPPPSPPPPVTKAKKVATDKDGERGEGSSSSVSAPEGPSSAEAPHDATMLIYTAHITMAVYQVEPGLAAVEKIAKDLGGYIATRSDTEITVRIPRGRFDEAVRRVGLTGDVVHRDISAEDVTDQVVDLEARLKNARNMRDRLAELLRHAEVKEAIEIEKELGRVTGEIEQMEGKLKVLRDKISYSSVTVSFQARGPGALRDVPLRLPFPWLSELGLPRLLSLHE